MAKLPRSIIKKYGISKKAWAVFRGHKTHKRTSTMAKHRRTHRKSSKGGMFGGGFLGKAANILIGAGIAVVYEVFISPMIPLSASIKNIVEFVLGLVLAVMPGMPMMVRAGGVAIATINAYAFIAPLLSGADSSDGSVNSGW